MVVVKERGKEGQNDSEGKQVDDKRDEKDQGVPLVGRLPFLFVQINVFVINDVLFRVEVLLMTAGRFEFLIYE